MSVVNTATCTTHSVSTCSFYGGCIADTVFSGVSRFNSAELPVLVFVWADTASAGRVLGFCLADVDSTGSIQAVVNSTLTLRGLGSSC